LNFFVSTGNFRKGWVLGISSQNPPKPLPENASERYMCSKIEIHDEIHFEQVWQNWSFLDLLEKSRDSQFRIHWSSSSNASLFRDFFGLFRNQFRVSSLTKHATLGT
jgi:hypothetical protein